MDMNKTILIGRLTKDPEAGTTKDGKQYSRFSLAVSGFRKDETHFLNCTAWGKTAEILCAYAMKGHRIGIDGHLSQNRWTDKNGAARSDITVVADSIQLLETKKTQQTGNPEPAPVAVEQFDDSQIPF